MVRPFWAFLPYPERQDGGFLMIDGDVQNLVTTTLPQLVALGRRRGFLTEGDILERLPDLGADPQLIETVSRHLEAADIEVLGGEELGRAVARRPEGGPTSGFEDLEGDDSISLYFREVGSVPLLSRDEEVNLARRIEAGRQALHRLRSHPELPAEERRDCDRTWQNGQAAWDHLVKANSRLVISLAKKFRGQGVPFLDLIQEGNVGLMKAADKFEYQRGYKFSTYATWWVRQAITRALANQGRTIRLPVHMSDRIRKLFAVAQAMEQTLGRRASAAELADRMDLPVNQVEQLLRVARRNLSLENPVGDEQDSELGHFIEDVDSPDPAERAAFGLLQSNLDGLLQCLTAREARILVLRYGLDQGRPHTLKEVGRKFELTRERIRQIEQEALAKLRHPRRRQVLTGYFQ